MMAEVFKVSEKNHNLRTDVSFTTNNVRTTGADLGKKLRGDLYAGLYSKIGSI